MKDLEILKPLHYRQLPSVTVKIFVKALPAITFGFQESTVLIKKDSVPWIHVIKWQ